MFKGLSIVITSAVLVAGFTSCNNESNTKTYSSKRSPVNIRSLASTSDTITAINKRTVEVKSKEEIVPLVHEVQKLAEAKQDDHALQIYALALKPVPLFESFIWRLRGVVEKSGAIHLSALSAITKAYYRDYMYGPHVKASLDYLTMPAPHRFKKFETVSEVQDFLEMKIKPEVEQGLVKLNAIMAKMDDSWTFDFDGHLITGYDEEAGKVFISSSKRYKTVIKPHLYYMKATMHRMLGAINYVVNYQADDIPKFAKELVKKSAINNLAAKVLMNGLPQVVTPKEVIAVLNKSGAFKKKFRNFLTARKSKDVMQKNLSASMNHYKQAAEAELMAFEQTIAQSDASRGSSYVINPNLIKIGREDTEHRLKEMIRIYEGAQKGEAVTVTSDITGAQVKVNVKPLFTAQNDLKTFLPQESSFTKGKRGSQVRYEEKSMDTEFSWNYSYGKPMSWPDPTFAGFIPEATNSNIYELARTLKLTDSLKIFSNFLPIP